MLTAKLKKENFTKEELIKLDEHLRTNVPMGFNGNKTEKAFKNTTKQFQKDFEKVCELINANNTSIQKYKLQLGSLGSGNHFYEMSKNFNTNEHYLIIHSGSRRFGLDICKYFEKKAIEHCAKKRDELNLQIKEELNIERKRELLLLRDEYKVQKEQSFLEGKLLEEYLFCASVAKQYSSYSRKIMLKASNLEYENFFETIHNYINEEDKIIRKGAIAAHEDELVLIPINMKDGSILAKGLGNEEWNYSGPHGAGRLFSRSEAKKTLDLEKFKAEMSKIVSSSVCESTLDEAPSAYKPIKEIKEQIEDKSVKILAVLKPILNLKAK